MQMRPGKAEGFSMSYKGLIRALVISSGRKDGAVHFVCGLVRRSGVVTSADKMGHRIAK